MFDEFEKLKEGQALGSWISGTQGPQAQVVLDETQETTAETGLSDFDVEGGLHPKPREATAVLRELLEKIKGRVTKICVFQRSDVQGEYFLKTQWQEQNKVHIS